MAGFTQHITVLSASYLAVTTVTQCNQVTIGEDPSVSGWPTTDFLIAKPNSSNTPRRVSAGNTYTFSAGTTRFLAGQVVGYVEIVTGTSTTFFQDEV